MAVLQPQVFPIPCDCPFTNQQMDKWISNHKELPLRIFYNELRGLEIIDNALPHSNPLHALKRRSRRGSNFRW